jgi:hypothetical protein
MLRGGTATVQDKQCQLYTFAGAAAGLADGASALTLQLCIAENRIQRAVWRTSGPTLTALFRYDVPVEISAPELEVR